LSEAEVVHRQNLVLFIVLSWCSPYYQIV